MLVHESIVRYGYDTITVAVLHASIVSKQMRILIQKYDKLHGIILKQKKRPNPSSYTAVERQTIPIVTLEISSVELMTPILLFFNENEHSLLMLICTSITSVHIKITEMVQFGLALLKCQNQSVILCGWNRDPCFHPMISV